MTLNSLRIPTNGGVLTVGESEGEEATLGQELVSDCRRKRLQDREFASDCRRRACVSVCVCGGVVDGLFVCALCESV
jgi:hypothetical protein